MKRCGFVLFALRSLINGKRFHVLVKKKPTPVQQNMQELPGNSPNHYPTENLVTIVENKEADCQP